MSNVVLRIIRADNKELVLDNAIWGIPSDGLIGFDTVDYEMFTEPQTNGDGGRDVGGRTEIKDRTIKARLKNPALNETMRHLIISFFNPNYNFKIYVKYMNETRWFEGKRVAFSCPTENIYKPLEFMVTFRSVMPYMLSVDDFNKDIAGVVPLVGFPYRSIVGLGKGTGAYKFADKILIENNGDVETFARATIVATGSVTNPKLIKDDKFVLINDTMEKGDVYEFDFVSIPPTVKKNGVKSMGKLDKTSAIMDMGFKVGKSNIGFDATKGSINMKVFVTYNKRYMGV